MTAPPNRYLAWPPPGLEPVHGRLWPAIAFLVIADMVLVMPLAATLGTKQSFTSIGPFGERWWILFLTTILGGLILTVAAYRLAQLAWSAGQGAQQGHGWRTILLVASDEARDAGFLLHGARQFSALAADQRNAIVTVRLAAASMALAGALLPVIGLPAAALLGRQGWMGTAGLWAVTLVLPLLLVALGLVARVAGHFLGRAAGKGDPRTHATALQTEIADWIGQARNVLPNRAQVLGTTGNPRLFRVAAIAGAAGVVVALGVLAFLTFAGAIGPVLMGVAVPNFGATEGRILEAEVYRPHVLPVDPSVSPRAAGEALHALTLVGSAEPPELMRAPVRTYPEHTFDSLPDGTRPDAQWMMDAFGRGGRGLSSAERAWLRQAAQHPALPDLAMLAAATGVSVVPTRYELPFPEDLASYALPIPRFGPLRDVARARLFAALLDLSEGRATRAEQGVREVISAGMRLVDDGPTLIDALIGTSLVREAGTAYEALLRATGRSGEADQITRLREQTRLVAERVRAVGMGGSVESAMDAMARVVTDTAVVRGLRWEFYTWVRAFAPCANLHTMVFGASDDYTEWVESARAALVRQEGDEELFQFLGRGLFGSGRCLPMFRDLQLVSSIQ